eukprot:COSAG06_NODE_16027_length_1027_cov_19.061422_2_plen_70_part_01
MRRAEGTTQLSHRPPPFEVDCVSRLPPPPSVCLLHAWGLLLVAELLEVGQKTRALDVLHEVLKSRRHRNW